MLFSEKEPTDTVVRPRTLTVTRSIHVFSHYPRFDRCCPDSGYPRSDCIRKDLNVATSYFTADYVSIDDKGESKSAEQIRQQYGPLLRMVKVTRSRISIQTFSAQGTQASALVKQRSDLLYDKSKLVREDTFRDTWIKTAEGWRIKQSQTLSVSTTMDGRPVSN
jgi:hypothetical protein